MQDEIDDLENLIAVAQNRWTSRCDAGWGGAARTPEPVLRLREKNSRRSAACRRVCRPVSASTDTSVDLCSTRLQFTGSYTRPFWQICTARLSTRCLRSSVG